MNAKQLMDVIGQAQDSYITSAIQTREGVPKPRRLSLKRAMLIAAVIALSLLLVGCGVVYLLNLQNMKVGEQQETYDIFSDDGMEYLGKETVTEQVLTLAGIKGSPTYQAAQEWFTFKQNYDTDGTILAEVWGNTPEFPAEYSRYGLYSQEMKDKVDEILEKHGLKPAGAILEFRTLKNMCTALGIERIQTASNNVTALVESGECHENGNFTMMTNFTLPEDADAEITSTWGILRWNRKDCFSDDMIALEEVDDWQEWNYTTASGSEVLMIRSSSDARGWIICDRSEAVLSLQLEARRDLYSDTGVEYQYLTDRQMEQIADAIDFGIQPRVATQEDVANQPSAPVSATQNGYTLTLKSVETDGYVAQILVGVTAPEGVDIESLKLGIGNRVCLTPVSGQMLGNSTISAIPDNDGLSNTKDWLIVTRFDSEDDTAPCAIGSAWNLSIVDLWADKHYDTERLLVEGEWSFPITFDETNGDYREIELLSEPIRAKACYGWDADGTDALEEFTVTSFKLRKFSSDITCDLIPDYHGIQNFGESADFYRYMDHSGYHSAYVAMKDGTEIELPLHGDVIDLDQVDHVTLADGTKLPMPCMQQKAPA